MERVRRAFEGRSVFVTGATGFKGAWLCLWLERLGAKVSGVSLAPLTENDLYVVAQVERSLSKHVTGDIRDFAALKEAFDQSAPDYVFHMAAQSLVRPSYANPRETFDTNVVGTANVLECTRLAGKPCVVIVVTSDKCYENIEDVWGYRESDRLGGHDPYSASKAAAELVVSAYRQSFFRPSGVDEHEIKLASVRAGNVIGGGDWAVDRIVPDLARALSRSEALRVRSPGAIRPWQHVLEALWGYLSLAAVMNESNEPKWMSAWNFGPNNDSVRTVRDLVERFIKVWGSGNWMDASDKSHPHEAKLLRLAIDKAVSVLGWKPIWSFETAVTRTADWYAGFVRQGASSRREACVNEILNYESDLAKASDP